MPYSTFKARAKDINYSKALYVKTTKELGLETIQHFFE
jgi:hypothetical protein